MRRNARELKRAKGVDIVQYKKIMQEAMERKAAGDADIQVAISKIGAVIEGKDFARLAGVSYSTVMRWRQGDTKASPMARLKILKIYQAMQRDEKKVKEVQQP